MLPDSPKESGEFSLSPWLASLMMRRGETVLPRFALYYERLRGMPRSFRRRLRRKLAVTVTAAALLLAMGGGAAWAEPAAPEATITVVNGQVGVNANGQCSLIEAILNANDKNNGRPHTDCAAGNPSGADTINLPADGLFTLTNVQTFDDIGDIGLPWISTTMTINGNGSTIQRAGNAPEFRVMAVGRKGNLTLNNTTISGGYISTDDSYSNTLYKVYGGAGILNQGRLTIANSVIFDNYVWDLDYGSTGGGIFNNGTLSVIASTIWNNEAYSWDEGSWGGGIYNSGALTITASNVFNNFANGYIDGSGGGIFNSVNGSLILIESKVSGNLAYGGNSYGGGISASGSLTIRDSTFYGNEARSEYPSGGGIFASGSSSISGSTFFENSIESYYCNGYMNDGCYSSGGAISNFGTMTIVNSTISSNQTHRYGGGIANFSDITIANTTVSGNIGGGVLSSCHLEDSITRFQRTIVSGNFGDEVTLFTYRDCSMNVTANKHNVFGRNGNSGLIGFSPGATDLVPPGALNTILSPLADNGGPTKTHALPANSPALDRAPNADCTAAPVNGIDQRGEPRNQNGAGANGSNECDAGAFERAGSGGGGSLPGFYASITGSGTIGGVPFVPADILRFDPNTGWSMFFDASDVGITKNVSAFEVQNDGSILLALGAKQSVAGVSMVLPQDILHFAPTTMGNTTSGTFSMWVDGSNVGLTTSGEKIDTLGLTADGRIAVGVTGVMAVAGSNGSTLKAQDEDALGFNRSNATWSNFFDGTSIPGLKGEDVNAIWVNPTTGELYITIIGAFNVAGVAGDGRDILKLTPDGGATGGYTVSLVYDGSEQGLLTNIDALEMIP